MSRWRTPKSRGIVVNGVTAWLFARGRLKGSKERDINLRAAFAHMLADALTSLGVVIAGLIIWRTGWQWVDPAMSLVISALIIRGSWGLLREATGLALQAAPADIQPEQVKAWLRARPGVTEVHDLHIWAMSTTETALTAHLLMPAYPGADFLAATTDALHHDFRIGHATLQIEVGVTSEACELAHHAAG